MKAREILVKEIVLEIIALVLFASASIYATITLKNKDTGKIAEVDGVVTILDDKNFKNLKIRSDGMGVEENGVTYAITNNNDEVVSYEIVISTNIHDEDLLNQIRVSLDDIYITDLSSLKRSKGGYILGLKVLNPGYTKVHSIKYWYKLDTDKELINKDVQFSYKIQLV